MTSLVLPAYNPGRGVERTWHAVRAFVRDRPDPWEAIFVCDGCTDGSDRLLEAFAEAEGDPRLRVIAYPTNRGKGFAVRTGLAAARGRVRLFTDVDLAYPFADVLKVQTAVRAGAGLAVASREHPDSVVRLPPAALGYAYRRRLQGRLFAAVARRLVPTGVADTQAGLKGMTAAVARAILPRLGCDGFGFDCELLAACRAAGVAVAEVPVCVRCDNGCSTTCVWSAARMLGELWAVRRRWRGRTLPPVPAVVTTRVAPPAKVRAE